MRVSENSRMNEHRLHNCPICRTNLEMPGSYDMEFGRSTFDCPSCGYFKCTEELDDVLPKLVAGDRVRLSGAIRELSDRAKRDRSAEFPLIRSDNIKLLLASAPASFDVGTKVRKMLSAVARHSAYPGEWVDFADNTSHPLAFGDGFGEWSYLTDYGVDQQWLEKDRRDRSGNIQLRLTPSGWEEVQRRPRIESVQGFVAMRFHRSTDDVYLNGFQPAIAECGYRCLRIDAAQFNGDIVDRLMAEIRDSRFVVADLTGHRRGVYFEAGFAMGLDIPVIWTCRSDRAGKTHFDAEHFNQIRWDSPADLHEKLGNRIKATIGRGPIQAMAVDN